MQVLLQSLQDDVQDQKQKNADLVKLTEQKESEVSCPLAHTKATLEHRVLADEWGETKKKPTQIAALSRDLQEKETLLAAGARSSAETEELLATVGSLTAERDQLKVDLHENIEMVGDFPLELSSSFS